MSPNTLSDWQDRFNDKLRHLGYCETEIETLDPEVISGCLASNPENPEAAAEDFATEDLAAQEYDDGMDGDHASALASAGWGTDEDYNFGGFDEPFELVGLNEHF